MTDQAMSPETQQRLMAAADRPLKLRRCVINLAAAATGHRKHPHGTSCETCREKWPCVDIQRAMSPILRAVDDMLDFHDEAARQLAPVDAADVRAREAVAWEEGRVAGVGLRHKQDNPYRDRAVSEREGASDG